MGTKIDPGRFDCYAAAEPDEPMFVLLGRDRHAPTLVWLWATLRELAGEDPEKVAEARECVSRMIRYAADHGRKVVGLGQATLAGAMELIRTVNRAVELVGTEPGSRPTDLDQLRLFLAETEFVPDNREGPISREVLRDAIEAFREEAGRMGGLPDFWAELDTTERLTDALLPLFDAPDAGRPPEVSPGGS